MRTRKFFLTLVAACWAILFIFYAVLTVFTISQLRKTEINNQVNELRELALAISVELRPYERMDDRNLEQTISTQARISGVRLTLIEPSGKVVFDTEKEAEGLESHRYRPEIDRALAGNVGWVIRYSDTLRKRMLYVAVPIRKNAQVVGICRVSRFLDLAVYSYQQARNRLMAGFALFVLLTWTLSYFLLRILFKPLEDLSLIVNKAAEEKKDLPFRVSLIRTIGPLAEDFNRLFEKNRLMTESLKEDKEIFQTFMDSTEEGWLLVDPDGKIILANQSLRQMFPEIGSGSEFYWQSLRSPELNQLLDLAQRSEKPVQCQLERKGRTYFCEASWLPLRQRYLLRFSDVTETRELAERKKEFVANLAHELKTPLTAIRGFLETLNGETLSQEGRNHLKIIQRNTERLVRLVEDLSRLSELEEKGLRLEKERVSLTDIVRAVASAYAKAAKEKSLGLKLEEEPLPEIYADPIQMEQLVLNLVDNAIRYTEKGGVTVSLAKKETGVQLSVSDTGIGIAEEHLARIFERFYVVDKSRSRKTGGTGLGLSIVKHIVLSHQGKIEVKSAPGFGTTFTVWLPAGSGDSQQEKN
jgi:two-component system phosphate regulon sensor histidine kinase PhoR